MAQIRQHNVWQLKKWYDKNYGIATATVMKSSLLWNAQAENESGLCNENA